jgi:hypothetical protein
MAKRTIALTIHVPDAATNGGLRKRLLAINLLTLGESVPEL